MLTCEMSRASNALILGDTTRTHIHGLRKIREKTQRWNSGEHEVAKSHKLDRLHQRTRHINVDHCQQATNVVSHSRYADHHVETMYRSIEKHTKIKAKNMKIVGGDFNALDQGIGPRQWTSRRHLTQYFVFCFGDDSHRRDARHSRHREH